MTAATRHPLVSRYLQELSAALSHVSEAERDDIVASVTEHIDSALAGRDDPDSDQLRRVLGELGDPMAIAASANRSAARPPRVPFAAQQWVPAAALVSMVVGGLLFFLVVPMALWLAGVALLWVSPLWRVWEKALGTVLVAPFGLVFFSSFALVASEQQSCASDSLTGETTCTGGGTDWLANFAFYGAVALVVAVAGYLWIKGARRARHRVGPTGYHLSAAEGRAG